MDARPKVSVLVITYNHQDYIAQALDSVLSQETDFPIEILIGDDCSTDNTGAIISQYIKDARVHVIPRKQNMGATRNLYDLQCRAQGEYLAYLEGDDFWSDVNKLQKQADFLDANSEFIGCTHQCTLVDEKGAPTAIQKVQWICTKEVYTLHDFRGLMLPGHGNAMVHRNIFANSDGQFEDLITLHPLIADRSLGLLLASFGPIWRFPECMGCYRIRASESENATSIAYKTNENRILDDFVYTKALEAYAEQILQVNGGFFYHKRDLFVSAVYNALKHPTQNNWNVVKAIFGEGNKLAYLCYFPYGFVKKAWNKIFRRYV